MYTCQLGILIDCIYAFDGIQINFFSKNYIPQAAYTRYIPGLGMVMVYHDTRYILLAGIYRVNTFCGFQPEMYELTAKLCILYILSTYFLILTIMIASHGHCPGLYWLHLESWLPGIYRHMPSHDEPDPSYDMLSHMTGLVRHMPIQDFPIVKWRHLTSYDTS
jgi:hypothetical protein